MNEINHTGRESGEVHANGL